MRLSGVTARARDLLVSSPFSSAHTKRSPGRISILVNPDPNPTMLKSALETVDPWMIFAFARKKDVEFLGHGIYLLARMSCRLTTKLSGARPRGCGKLQNTRSVRPLQRRVSDDTLRCMQQTPGPSCLRLTEEHVRSRID